MEKELKTQSIVVLAQSFNPTIFNLHWLVKNNFVLESEIQKISFFTPNVSNIVTNQFNLLVVPEQLQFNAGTDSINFDKDIKNTLLPIINKLPEIPFLAIGLNFNWFIKDEKKNIRDLSKDLFFNYNSNLYKDFEENDSRFGAYLSKNFLNTRLKLDIKPVYLSNIDNAAIDKSEFILCNFNFHLDFINPDTTISELIGTINLWDVFKNESEKIINLL